MSGDDNGRDVWAKAEIVAKILGSVLLPVVLVVIGYWFTNQQRLGDDARVQQQRNADNARIDAQRKADSDRLDAQSKADEEQRNADRMATLVKYLASDREPERFFGTNLVAALAEDKLVPIPIAQVVFTVGKDDPSKRVKDSANDALARLVAASPDKFLAPLQKLAATGSQSAATLKTNAQLNKALTSIAESGPTPEMAAAGDTLRTLFAASQSLADCPPTGAAVPGSPQALINQIKQRIPAGQPTNLTFADFEELQDRADAAGVPHGHGPGPTADQRQMLKGFRLSDREVGEGSLVKLVGYVKRARQEGRESFNGYLTGPANNDLHLSLIDKPSDPEEHGIVAEMIPQRRPDSWSADALNAVARIGRPVMVTGQLFFDSAHNVRDNPNTQAASADPARMSLWEIHPVTSFLVCLHQRDACDPNNPDSWVPLEKWTASSAN